MLISYNALQYALYKDKNLNEKYQEKYQEKYKNAHEITIQFAIILLVFELVLLYFALSMAVQVSKSKKQLFVHIMMATLFTLPYVFYNVVFETPAYQTLAK